MAKSNAKDRKHTKSSKAALPKEKKSQTKKEKKITAAEVPAMLVGKHFRTTPFEIRVLAEGDVGVKIPNRVQLFKTGTFRKLQPDGTWLEIIITKETLAEIIKNFKENVRGVDLAIDFAHKSDDAAAGWIKNLTLEDWGKETQLWAEVDWTPDGRSALGGKRFRYLSPDFAFAYTDNETGKKFGATLFGAGLTNRPVIKNMAPAMELTEVEDMAKKKTTTKKIWELSKEELEVRLSEETDEEKKEFIQHRLDEMADEMGEEADDQGESDQDEDNPKPDPESESEGKKKEKKLSYAELAQKCEEMAAELADLKKQMAKSMAETATAKKSADFDKLLVSGKAVEAQRKPFMEGDTIKFAELQAEVKLKSIGNDGKPITPTKSSDEIVKLAEAKIAEAKKNGEKIKYSHAVSVVLAENPALVQGYQKEMGY